QQTGSPLDLAIQGDGFFRVGDGNVVGSGAGYSYTRAGNFTLDSSGTLVTQDGALVIGYGYQAATNSFPAATTNETKITIPAGGKSVSIGSDGVVSYVDAAGAVQKL